MGREKKSTKENRKTCPKGRLTALHPKRKRDAISSNKIEAHRPKSHNRAKAIKKPTRQGAATKVQSRHEPREKKQRECRRFYNAEPVASGGTGTSIKGNLRKDAKAVEGINYPQRKKAAEAQKPRHCFQEKRKQKRGLGAS